MNEASLPLDAHRNPIRIGDVVRRTMVIDHAGKLYTAPARGLVVDFLDGMIVVSMKSFEYFSVRPWPAHEWAITGHEDLS